MVMGWWEDDSFRKMIVQWECERTGRGSRVEADSGFRFVSGQNEFFSVRSGIPAVRAWCNGKGFEVLR